MSGARPRTLHVVSDSMLASAIRQRRLDGDLTQTEFGELIGVRQQTVAAWERGDRPQRRFFGPLAEALQVGSADDIRSLLDGRSRINRFGGRPAADDGSGRGDTEQLEPTGQRRAEVALVMEAFRSRMKGGLPLSDEEVRLFRDMLDQAKRVSTRS